MSESGSEDRAETNAPARDVDDYLAILPEAEQVALESLRGVIKEAAP